jgi:EAL domain-containing protein (putative c-di-GMP-specific phosphodiesterase class I)
MPELGAWVLNHALQHAKGWRQHHADLYVSVNVSATQFALADFVQQVQGALDLHQVPGEVLVLELTESTLIGDADASVLKMRALKELGVRIALDDFGTGYSSLSYLRQLPVDLLKIDQSFIRTLRDGGASFVRAIVTLAHDQGAIVVAESVEEAWQADVLSHLKCNLAQGYLFAKPLPFSQAQHYALSASPTPEAHS